VSPGGGPGTARSRGRRRGSASSAPAGLRLTPGRTYKPPCGAPQTFRKEGGHANIREHGAHLKPRSGPRMRIWRGTRRDRLSDLPRARGRLSSGARPRSAGGGRGRRVAEEHVAAVGDDPLDHLVHRVVQGRRPATAVGEQAVALRRQVRQQPVGHGSPRVS